MNIKNITTIEEIETFLTGSQAIVFRVASGQVERYEWIRKTLIKFDYMALSRRHKGIMRTFLRKISGYSRSQLARLTQQYTQTGEIHCQVRHRYGFQRHYTSQDIALLAEMDERFETPNGAAVKKLCERAYHQFGQTEFKNLAGISVSHLYNLRQSKGYLRLHRQIEKTQCKASTIGERRKPKANGMPGYIRVDTVHQGDYEGCKGVYHINAVDEVTQFEVVVSVEKISEAYLIPALRILLETFPFKLLNFHSDNGSEYINRQVAKLLKKLLIELTKSRPRHSNDNALAESKNAAIVRKTFGYIHIPQRWAERINQFNMNYLNPYINYHRPCYFPTSVIDKKGKEVKHYRYQDMMTPYDKLKSLPKAGQYLKKGVTFNDLDTLASKLNDCEAADQLHKERKRLFKEIYEQDKRSA